MHGLSAPRDRILASLSAAEMHVRRARARPRTPHLQIYLGDDEPDRLHPWLRREVFVHVLHAEFEDRTRIPERYGIAFVRRSDGAGKVERLGRARLDRATECFFVGWNCTPFVRRPVDLARFPWGVEDDRLRYLRDFAAYDLARCMTDPNAAWEPLDAAFGYIWSCAEVFLLPSGVWVRRNLYDVNTAGFLPAVELLEGDELTAFLSTVDRLNLPFLDECPTAATAQPTAPAHVPLPPAAETASAPPPSLPATGGRPSRRSEETVRGPIKRGRRPDPDVAERDEQVYRWAIDHPNATWPEILAWMTDTFPGQGFVGADSLQRRIKAYCDRTGKKYPARG